MMMRTLFSTGLIAALTAAPLTAQDFAGDKRSGIVSGAAAIFSRSGEIVNDERLTSVNLGGSGMYFVSPRFAVGGSLVINAVSQADDTDTQFGLGPIVGYWWAGEGKKAIPFVTVAARFLSVSDAFTQIDLEFTGGADVLVSRNVAITFGAFYRIEMRSPEGLDETVNGNVFSAIAGLRLFVF